MIRKKILLVGDFNVGKTSLIRRYVDDAFDDDYLTTIGVKISKKRLGIDGVDCELMIWDIEGATASKRIPLNYFHGASGAVFVADINRDDSMRNLKQHVEAFLSVNPSATYVTAYNKSDLLDESRQKTMDLDERTFLTSAKEDLNVAVLFNTLAGEMCR